MWPRASRPSRSSRKFSMIPLWMTVILPVQSTWGWALRSFGRPWVAQRVWARPDRGVRRPIGDRRRQVGELAGLLLDEEVALLVDEGDARRVVAAVLEAPQALDEDRARLAGPRVADDAAHRCRSLRRFVARALRGRRRAPGSRRGAPWIQCSRSAARVASASASSETTAASGPSTMTRSAGSVPDGRTRIRPPPREARFRLANRPLEDRIALPLVLVTNPDRALLLGQERDRARRARRAAASPTS